MKKIVGIDVLLSYPNFIEEFIIHTYAGKTHIRILIILNGKPITYYSRKSTPEQINYTTT